MDITWPWTDCDGAGEGPGGPCTWTETSSLLSSILSPEPFTSHFTRPLSTRLTPSAAFRARNPRRRPSPPDLRSWPVSSGLVLAPCPSFPEEKQVNTPTPS